MKNFNSIIKKIISIALVLTVTVSLVCASACGENVSVQLDKTALELSVGTNKKITATITGESEQTTIEWSSSDSAVATVSSKGVVSAKSEGKSTITAKVGSASAKCEVTVVAGSSDEPVVVKRTAFSGGIGTESLFVGDEINVRPTLTVNGEVKSDANVSYTFSDQTVATVENGVLTALKAGSTTIVAKCTYNGVNYEESVTLSVSAFDSETYAIVDGNGKLQSGLIMFVNGKTVAEQLKIKYYSANGIDLYSLEYNSANGTDRTFNLTNGSVAVGSIKLSLTDGNGASVIDTAGVVNAALVNDRTVSAEFAIKTVTVGGKEIDGAGSALKAYVKAPNVYTDFVEYVADKPLTKDFSYDATKAGAKIEVNTEVTYNGTPTLKITVPTNYSYFHLNDIINNYADYGLKSGSRISFKICFDGTQPNSESRFYAIGKITTKNGEVQYNTTNVIGYLAATDYICENHTHFVNKDYENIAWQDVTYVINDDSLPLADLGLQIAGNSKSDYRYIYIAKITIDNPGDIDYTKSFGYATDWDKNGKNINAGWWGYSIPVSDKFEINPAPTGAIANAYRTAFGEDLEESVPVVTPNLAGITDRVVLQNSSCPLNNKMKGLIHTGYNKVKVRLYMEATGTLPANSSVTSIVFIRNNGDAKAYGLTADKLKTLNANEWTEFTFDVSEGYLEADFLTVAFNVKNYYNCNENVTVRFYLGNIRLVNA